MALKYQKKAFLKLENILTVEQFRKLLDNSGYKMQKLADIAGVKIDTVYQWRIGTRNPKKINLIKILKFLGEEKLIEKIN